MVNVVAMVVVLASFIPVYFAQRLTREGGGLISRGEEYWEAPQGEAEAAAVSA